MLEKTPTIAAKHVVSSQSRQKAIIIIIVIIIYNLSKCHQRASGFLNTGEFVNKLFIGIAQL